MATNERSVELAGVNLTGQNHVCTFFNTMDEEHRVLRSFYKGGFERSEKATHIVDSDSNDRDPSVPLSGDRHPTPPRQEKSPASCDGFGAEMLHSVEYQRRYYN
jgi:hypothetical protein